MTTNQIFDESETRIILDIKEGIKQIVYKDVIGFHHHGLQTIIAGGHFANQIQTKYFQAVPAGSDIDVFVLCPDKQAENKAYDVISKLPNSMRRAMKRRQKEYMPKNENILMVIDDTDRKIQYILCEYKDREELIEHFDYVHCCVSYDLGEDRLYLTKKIFDAAARKKLVVNNKENVVMWRQRKFIDRGYTMDEPTIVAKYNYGIATVSSQHNHGSWFYQNTVPNANVYDSQITYDKEGFKDLLIAQKAYVKKNNEGRDIKKEDTVPKTFGGYLKSILTPWPK